MARINGVVSTGQTEIEVKGTRYELVEGPAKKGDIAKIVIPWGDQVRGAFYPVINEDHYLFDKEAVNLFAFIDGEVGHASCYLHKVQVFRKVIESVKTEKRPAKKGERIVITDAEPIRHQSYVNGDVLTVTSEHVYEEGDVYVAGQPDFIDHREYEVVIEDHDTDTINVGDTVRLNVPTVRPKYGRGRASNGEIGTVLEVNGSKITVKLDRQDRWQADVSELELVKPETFEVGDIVHAEDSLHKIIGEITFGPDSDGDYDVTSGTEYAGYFSQDELTLIVKKEDRRDL